MICSFSSLFLPNFSILFRIDAYFIKNSDSNYLLCLVQVNKDKCLCSMVKHALYVKERVFDEQCDKAKKILSE